MGDPYISVEKDYKPNDIKYREAAHVMFFARTKRKLWDKLPYGAFINMHLRFDGRLGFPGGLIDKVDNSILYSLVFIIFSPPRCTREKT